MPWSTSGIVCSCDFVATPVQAHFFFKHADTAAATPLRSTFFGRKSGTTTSPLSAGEFATAHTANCKEAGNSLFVAPESGKGTTTRTVISQCNRNDVTTSGHIGNTSPSARLTMALRLAFMYVVIIYALCFVLPAHLGLVAARNVRRGNRRNAAGPPGPATWPSLRDSFSRGAMVLGRQHFMRGQHRLAIPQEVVRNRIVNVGGFPSGMRCVDFVRQR